MTRPPLPYRKNLAVGTRKTARRLMKKLTKDQVDSPALKQEEEVKGKIRKGRTARGTFAKGISGNIKGRPVGSRNKSYIVRSIVKPVNNTRRKPPLEHPKGGRPKGSRNKATILREAIQRNAPDLFERLLEVARSGDVVALKTVLAPLLPKGNTVPWTFNRLDTADDIMHESERVLRAMESGKLTLDEAEAIQGLLDKHIARANLTGDRRSEFEKGEIALALIRGDEQCRQLAQALASRFDELEQAALESGQLTAPAPHVLIEVARQAVKP